MTAFMVAKSDGDSYGQLQVFTMPRSNLPNGPALVQGEIQSNDEVSRQESLLGTVGSRVSYGSLAAIPIDNGLVWIRPFYVTSTQTNLPNLRFVIVNYEGNVAIQPTLLDALADVFDQDLPEGEQPPPDGGEEPEEPEGTVDEQVAALLTEAADLFEQADQALSDRDLAEYERLTEEAKALVQTGPAAAPGSGRRRGADHDDDHHRGNLGVAPRSGGGRPLPGLPVEVDRGGVERIAQVDDGLRQRAGPPLPAVLGDDGRHPDRQVVDPCLQLHRHLGQLGRDAGGVEAHLQQVVLGGQVEVALVAGQLVQPVLHPRQPLVELLRVDRQGHQRPFGAERRQGRRLGQHDEDAGGTASIRRYRPSSRPSGPVPGGREVFTPLARDAPPAPDGADTHAGARHGAQFGHG